MAKTKIGRHYYHFNFLTNEKSCKEKVCKKKTDLLPQYIFECV